MEKKESGVSEDETLDRFADCMERYALAGDI